MHHAIFSRFAMLLLAFAYCAGAAADISIVGSSTVYPFATVVGERFGQVTGLSAPRIESTGTGGGMKLLCAGDGPNHPDISNASRKIKQSEIDLCMSSGAGGLVEVKIGYDGIVFAQSIDADQIELTRGQLFSALAREIPTPSGDLVANASQTWSDIDPSLPSVPIQVYGPPPTSGTRDAFVEMVMEEGCEQMPGYDRIVEDRMQAACKAIREDGPFIEAGENDNLIIQRLANNANAFGIFGYSFLEENADRVRGVPLEGVEPTFESIADSTYPISRPLFFYAKSKALVSKPELAMFVEFFAAEEAIGEDGFLSDRGLIPLSADERSRMLDDIEQLFALNL